MDKAFELIANVVAVMEIAGLILLMLVIFGVLRKQKVFIFFFPVFIIIEALFFIFCFKESATGSAHALEVFITWNLLGPVLIFTGNSS